jgi:protein tyrosine phosphatase (PTP) superfamily phosphohydrolase (DUF442 family)
MKAYKFAKITVRHYPNICDVNNKWIFTDETTAVINVSQKDKKEITGAIIAKGMDYHHFPLAEEVSDIGWENIVKAVKAIHKYDMQDKHIIVHCDGGQNRSRTVVEAYHFAKTGQHITDEYKGYMNHLIYNSSSGYLPPLDEIEAALLQIVNNLQMQLQLGV